MPGLNINHVIKRVPGRRLHLHYIYFALTTIALFMQTTNTVIYVSWIKWFSKAPAFWLVNAIFSATSYRLYQGFPMYYST